jgi:rhodanese-related sulfurtransferase
MRDVTPSQLHTWMHEASPPLVLDVREPWEYQACRIDGSLSIPMGSLPARLQDLDPDQPTVVVCHHGVRSLQVAMFLEHAGFADVNNLRGGVEAWAKEVDLGMPRY